MGRRISRAVLSSLGLGHLAMAAACTLLTDLDGYVGERNATAERADGGGDSGMDGQPTDGPVAGDGGVEDGGATEDAGLDACADPSVLLGTNDLTGASADEIPHFALDAYGYTAVGSGVARCVWIYIEGRPTRGKVRVGVYTESESKPRNLITNVTMENVVEGAWNKMPLPVPIPIQMGDRLWLGVAAGEPPPDAEIEVVEILNKVMNCAPPFGRAADIGSSFPPVYAEHTVFDGACNALMYLGR